MSENIEIYKAHLQSADKLDERRDATVRTYGSVCVVIVTVAVGLLPQDHLFASLAMCVLLVLVASIWRETLEVLNAKLTAKSKGLMHMEREELVPFQFLIKENGEWERSKTRRMRVVSKFAPDAFGAVGVLGITYYIYALFLPAPVQ